jgi:hypothetical protein
VASESAEQTFRQLTGTSKESLEANYAVWSGETHLDLTLEPLVRKRFVTNLHSANLRESLMAMIRAGGGAGEWEPQSLLRTGLTGWS